jgi:hypothetical protein
MLPGAARRVLARDRDPETLAAVVVVLRLVVVAMRDISDSW